MLNVNENIIDIVHDLQRFGEKVTTFILEERWTLPGILTQEEINANVSIEEKILEMASELDDDLAIEELVDMIIERDKVIIFWRKWRMSNYRDMHDD